MSKLITDFPMNANLVPLGYYQGAKVTVTFKTYFLTYGRKSIFHNVTELGAYDFCVGNPGFTIHSEGLNGQCFELSDIESVTIEKEAYKLDPDNWCEYNQ
jgi:hypothetical protein